MNDPTNKVTGTVTGTQLRVWYVAGPTTTAPAVKIDGVVQVPPAPASADPAVPSSRYTYELGPSGPHTVEIAKTAGPCYIEGLEVFDGNCTAGLQLLNAARSGWSTVQFAAISGNTPDGRPLGNGAAWKAAVAAANPHLVTIMLGMNDFSQKITPEAFLANITTIVGWIRSSATVWPSIVLIMPHKRNTVGLLDRQPWERYEHGLAILADQLGCGYLDMRLYMPDADPSGTGLYATDGIHPNAAGHAQIGQAVADYLLGI